MPMASLDVRLTTADSALPVSNAQVKIFDMNRNLLHTVYTDENGMSPEVSLSAPSVETQFDPNITVKPYTQYIVEITANGFDKVVINGVQVYGGTSSTLPIDMHVSGSVPHLDEYNIGENALEDEKGVQNQEFATPATSRIHREVFIPTYITVHLGVPASNARNVTVRFVDYIKNVASSEIFPDWPYQALRANIHAQISLALNRVFTEWYRGKGYNFDITNSTQYDQYYVEGRNIYNSVSVIADEIFNTYVIKPPGIEPYYTEYCNGTTSTCPGMKQWGTVTLANQGRNYLEILRYYYGSNIYIAETENIRTPFESFNGNLTLGSSGQDVALIQMQLSRIRQNYPRIPAVAIDGVYGSQTVAAVREFQSIFGLPQTGTVDRRTWYQISNIFSAVMKLAELGSEGFRPPTVPPGPPVPPVPPPTPPTPPYPGTPLRVGSRGENVRLMQEYLNAIAAYYPSIPRIAADGIFGSATQTAVIAFQRTFGLTTDGIIGPLTWARIVAVYNQLGTGTAPAYPGTPLRVGSRGNAVVTLQEHLNRVAASNPAIPRVSVDGIFGPATQTAVMAFQNAYGLAPDGIVGPLTWNRLMQVSTQRGIAPGSGKNLLPLGSQGGKC